AFALVRRSPPSPPPCPISPCFSGVSACLFQGPTFQWLHSQNPKPKENRMFSLISRPMEGPTRTIRVIALALSLACFLCAVATSALAQGVSTDARMIAMGGSDQSSDSTSLSDVTKKYSSFGLPLGLIQIYRHRDAFNPKDKVNFNPLLAIEDLSNPMHITFGRQSE